MYNVFISQRGGIVISFFETILSYIVTAFIVVQSVLSLPFNTLIFGIDSKAAVFESGDSMYTVIWSTNLPATGYVTYTYGGQEYTAKDERNGAVRSTDTIHSVRVPKEHLDGNSYTYHSQQIGTKQAYMAIKGKSVSSSPVEFRGYCGQDTVRALVASDIHENIDGAVEAAGFFDESPDMVIINGDAVSTMTSKIKIKQIIQYANTLSAGSIPVIYTCGNHEKRGEYASDLVDIFRTTTGGLYFTCDYGPVHFICLDSAEDKDDSNDEYSGLVDYTAYISRETDWMKTLSPDDDAEYTVAISHIPDVKNKRYGFDWRGILEGLGTDLVVSGHHHKLDLEYNSGADYYQLLDGGKEDDTSGYIATMLTFCGGEIKAECYDRSGEMRGEKTYTIQ